MNAIAIDTLNNYYFLAETGSNGTNYNNNNYTTYNTNLGRDAYLVSTDCEGNFRWQKTFGGSQIDYGRDVAADSLGGIYSVGYTYTQFSSTPANYVHFDTDSIIPQPIQGFNDPGPHHKGLFLVKYDYDGNYQWLRQPEGGVPNSQPTTSEVNVTADGQVHWLVAFAPGTHLDGTLTVPDTPLYYSWHVLRYDKDGNYLGQTPIGLQGANRIYSVQFAYDANNQRYYIAAYNIPNTNSAGIIGYDGVQTDNDTFLVAVDANNGNLLWRIDNSSTTNNGTAITSLALDENSNIYIGGMSQNDNEQNTDNNGDSFAGYQFDQTFSGDGTGSGTSAPFVIKLDPQGNLLWGSNPDGYSDQRVRSLSVNNSEVAGAMGLYGNTWDGLQLDRPNAASSDPVVVRFDAATGSALAIHDILGTNGERDELTAIATDRYGNYVVGGFVTSQLFLATDDNVPTLTKQGGNNDFFTAKLATNDCEGEQLSINEKEQQLTIKAYPNPAGQQLFFDGLNGSYTYALYDVQGRLVKQGRLGEQKNAIDVGSLTQGLYLVKLSSGGVEQVVRFVKE